jgi:hypothetical protein
MVLTQPTYGGMQGCGAADDVDAYYGHELDTLMTTKR